MSTFFAKTPGQAAYEEELKVYPCYEDGSPRKTWVQLSDLARWSWERNATPRVRVSS